MNDRIEKQVELKAPVPRVWRAIADPAEFGAWFRVKFLDPFAPGKRVRGTMTYPGYEGMALEIVIRKIEPETLFSFTWHPYAVDPKLDTSKETPTLVEFRLQKSGTGTLLTVVESGFGQLPPGPRALEAFRMNEGGWTEQMKNVGAYVAGS